MENLTAKQLKVLEFMKRLQKADMETICSTLQISESTARRILAVLEKAGLVRRYRGGATIVRNEAAHESPVVCRSRTMVREKDAIAQAACEYIHDGDTILLTAGSTVSRMCAYLAGFQNLTVLTDSLVVEQALSQCKSIRLYLLGGIVDPDEQCTYGFLTQENVASFKINTLFSSSRALDLKLGMLTDDMQHMLLYKQYLQHADQVVALIDHSKLGASGTGILYPYSDIDHLLIDDAAPEETIQTLQSNCQCLRLCPVNRENA